MDKETSELAKLTKEEREIAVNKWVNENWAVRYIRLNRGHYEDILPSVCEAQLDKAAPIIEATEKKRILAQISDGNLDEYSLGYKDGEAAAKQDEALNLARIAREINIYLDTDFGADYSGTRPNDIYMIIQGSAPQ